MVEVNTSLAQLQSGQRTDQALSNAATLQDNNARAALEATQGSAETRGAVAGSFDQSTSTQAIRPIAAPVDIQFIQEAADIQQLEEVVLETQVVGAQSISQPVIGDQEVQAFDPGFEAATSQGQAEVVELASVAEGQAAQSEFATQFQPTNIDADTLNRVNEAFANTQQLLASIVSGDNNTTQAEASDQEVFSGIDISA